MLVRTLKGPTHTCAQKLGESSCETMSNVEWLREVIEAWPKLSAELRAAVPEVMRPPKNENKPMMRQRRMNEP